MGIFERKLDSFCGPMDEHGCVCALCMCVLCDVYMCVQVHTSVHTHTEALYRCSLPISLRQGLSLSQKLITSARRLEVSSGTWLPLPQHCGCNHGSRGAGDSDSGPQACRAKLALCHLPTPTLCWRPSLFLWPGLLNQAVLAGEPQALISASP